MRVPFSFIQSGGAPPGPFDPATLDLSGWWRADYAGAPWSGNASAGVSGTTGALVTAGFDPDVGAAQNGWDPAEFVAANTDHLVNATDATTLFTTTAGAIVCLFRAASADAQTGSGYDDAPFYRDSNADLAMTFTTSGVGAVAYDGGYKIHAVACGTGAYHLAMMRWNGSTLGITLDSASESTIACSTLTVLTGTALVAYGYGGTHKLDARVLELMTSPTAISPTDYGNIKSYVNDRYGLSL